MEPGSLFKWLLSRSLLRLSISSHYAFEISVQNNTLHFVKLDDSYNFHDCSWDKIL